MVRILQRLLVIVLMTPLDINLCVVGDLTKGNSLSNVKMNKCCPLKQYFNSTQNACVKLTQELSNEDDTTWEVPMEFKLLDDTDDFPLSVSWNKIGFPTCSEPIKTVVMLNNTENRNSTEGYAFSVKGILHRYIYNPYSFSVNHNQHLRLYVNHRLNEFCVDPLSEDSVIVRVCPVNCTKESCIRKCCPIGEHVVYQGSDGGEMCVPSKSISQDKLDNDENWKWHVPLHSAPGKVSFLTQPRFNSGYPMCPKLKSFAGGWKIPKKRRMLNLPFILMEDGRPFQKVIVDKNGERIWSQVEGVLDFCVDRLEAHSNFSVCPGEEEIMFYCPVPVQNTSQVKKDGEVTGEEKDGWWILYIVFVVAALFFLLLTIVILLALWEKQNIHSWTRLAYVISHFFLFFLLSLAITKASPRPGSVECKFYAALLHFFGLCTICWLSVINFDLWWTFKVLKPTSDLGLNLRRFLQYAVFAVGVPLIVIAIAFIIQSRKPEMGTCRADLMEGGLIYADYGLKDCVLSKKAQGVYWYLPLSILLIANLIFFLTTTCKMVSLHRLTRRASIESTGGGTQSSKVFIKIFIVCGITWNLELIGWFWDKPSRGPWFLLDMAHNVQAICLFIIFVCKREVMRNLQTRYPLVKKYFPTFLHVANDEVVVPSSVRFQRSATIGSMSTDVHIINKSRISGLGRKSSTTSTSSLTPSCSTPTEKYQKHDNFDAISLSLTDKDTTTPMPLIQ